MKHSGGGLLKKRLSKTISLINKNKGVSLKVGSSSLIPFVLSCFDFKKLVVCEPGFFGDIYSSFGVFPEGVVGFPRVRSFDRGDFVIKSFNQELFSQSSIYLSCKKEGVDVCVVDVDSLNSVAVCIKKDPPLLVGAGGCSKKTLLSFLKKHNYALVDSVVSPGEFVVRGGVVDVFSFGLSFPFRVGFFDSTKKVLFFNPSTGNVVKKKNFCHIFPSPKQPKKTILESVSSFYKITYVGGFLNIWSPESVGKKLVISPDVVSVLDYSDFKKKSSVKPVFSNLLLSEACAVNRSIFLPFWFSEKLNTIDKEAVPLSGSLCVGDYYIHEMFGVCQYLGFSVLGEQNEKVSLAFADGKMALDVRLLGRLSFYAPASSADIQLNSLNKKGAWRRKKKKTLKEASDFVGSLIDSYVERDLQTNFNIVVDKEFISRFLFAFPFVDTHDQAAAWKSILKDLISEKPMHRLLCGDVGFGKTELAMRAAFLLCTNNKKTIVLCPTTILSDQLFNCFKERLAPFGATVAQITRLTKNNTSTASSFIGGSVDVLIGTHALLQIQDVLRTASLIIVDEEHRFGVKDKEKILSMSPRCHYLNMSATPIPRTLQLSLSGIRNISTLLSPPSQRKPIITNIYFYKKTLLKTILLDEMSRGGQVFIVDNSVQNIQSLFSTVSSLLPLFPAGLLYGSMKKGEINKTMSLFRSGKIKILVSTVIIESGIDVPSANTIIINNSHLFGLSQLHQLRGRVGRSNSQSYAYLFLPRAHSFSSEGKMRLRAIKKHSSLGSGYRLAIQDLEIRGAGSLFGYKQSGKASVGFEFYSKLLASAMKNKKYGSSALVDAEVDLGRAFISSSFMPVDGERAYYYKSISDCVDVSSLLALLKKTKRLFGRLPENFYLLFLAKEVSLFCGPTPIIKVVKSGFDYSLVFSPVAISNVSSFLLLLEAFFTKKNILFIVRPLSNLIKIQFTYIHEDYYILLKNLAKKIHV